jgi:hypothetical protein
MALVLLGDHDAGEGLDALVCRLRRLGVTLTVSPTAKLRNVLLDLLPVDLVHDVHI